MPLVHKNIIIVSESVKSVKKVQKQEKLLGSTVLRNLNAQP